MPKARRSNVRPDNYLTDQQILEHPDLEAVLSGLLDTARTEQAQSYYRRCYMGVRLVYNSSPDQFEDRVSRVTSRSPKTIKSWAKMALNHLANPALWTPDRQAQVDRARLINQLEEMRKSMRSYDRELGRLQALLEMQLVTP